MSDFAPELLDRLAGLAALVNGLLLWPIVKQLKNTQAVHGQRLQKLEGPRKKKKGWRR